MSVKKIPFFRALLWIALSTVLVSGSAATALWFYHYQHDQRASDSRYNIIALVQTGPEREQLKTPYLAQLLDLSIDKPTNLYQFKTYEAKRKLLSSPLIKEVEVKKIAPGTIYLDYILRKPVAYLGDFDNTALDNDGFLFPFRPYFTPKRIPEFFLGIDHAQATWGNRIQDPVVRLAFDVLSAIKKYCTIDHLLIRRIDVSKAYSESYGHRQIVVALEENDVTTILRLNTEDYKEALRQYMALRANALIPSKELNKLIVIDLRITNLAFITPNLY